MDDITGEALILRDDDREGIIRKRLEVYHTQTEPLISFYKQLGETDKQAPKFHRVAGQGGVTDVFQRILSVII